MIIFSNRLWYCMSQYGEITPMLVTTLPSFRGLTSLNIAHIATDQLVATISRHLANLLSLNVSGSEVTDDAIRFIAGMSIEQTCKRGLTVFCMASTTLFTITCCSRSTESLLQTRATQAFVLRRRH